MVKHPIDDIIVTKSEFLSPYLFLSSVAFVLSLFIGAAASLFARPLFLITIPLVFLLNLAIGALDNRFKVGIYFRDAPNNGYQRLESLRIIGCIEEYYNSLSKNKNISFFYFFMPSITVIYSFLFTYFPIFYCIGVLLTFYLSNFFLSVISYNSTYIYISDEELYVMYMNRERKFKIDEINDMEESNYYLNVRDNEKEEKIWTPNPTTLKNIIVSKKL
jgi:hypothetical protein